MIEANKYKLGIFVVSGITVLVIVLFLLGISEIFKPKVAFVSLFDESVQGLEVGAPVKFKGVTIGKVSSITVRPNDNYVRVDMEALLSAIDTGSEGSVITRKAEFFYRMEKEVEKGLRCRLDLTGITGMKYVELNYYDIDKIPVSTMSPPKGTRYIPSTPSFLKGLSSSVTTALARISSIDFNEISTQLVNTLKSVNNLVNDPKLNSLIQKMENVGDHLEITSQNVNKVLTESNLRDITDEFKKSVSSINELSVTLQKEVENAKISETAQNARTALKETGNAAKSVSEIKEELSSTLTKLDEAIDSFTELIKSLEEDPSSVVRGKQKAPEKF